MCLCSICKDARYMETGELHCQTVKYTHSLNYNDGLSHFSFIYNVILP